MGEDEISNIGNSDKDSRLGTYLEINPDLVKPRYHGLFEFERVCITRYRTGAHNLRIETGRMNTPVVPREDRLCICNNDIQTLRHVLLICPLIAELRQKYNIETIEEAISNANFLIEMEKILKI